MNDSTKIGLDQLDFMVFLATDKQNKPDTIIDVIEHKAHVSKAKQAVNGLLNSEPYNKRYKRYSDELNAV